MDQKTTAAVNELTQAICSLIHDKSKSSSADDQAQLPSLIVALAILVRFQP